MAYNYTNYQGYYPQNYQQPVQRYNLGDQQFIPQQQVMQNVQPQIIKSGLQGKTVDSVEVVKAIDIPLDGSISYYPLADGTAIVTKQLQMDGTSKVIVYKPIENEQPKTSYVTSEELEEKIKSIEIPDFKKITKQIKDMKEDIEELKEGR